MKHLIEWKLYEQKEEKEIQLFFLHPKDTFNTDIEDKSIELINIYFENPYIENYSNNKSSLQKLPEINTVVILPKSNNRIDNNIMNDIKYAFSKDMNVYWLSPSLYKIFKKNLNFFSDKVENETKNDLEKYFSE